MFYQYCRELGFDQKPDYGYLHRLLRDLIYIESFNYMICFEWLVKKQEWREQSAQSNMKQRSVVKEKMAEAFGRRDHFQIKPVPIMILGEQVKLPLESQDVENGRNSKELEAQEKYDLDRIIAHALKMNDLKNEEIL